MQRGQQQPQLQLLKLLALNPKFDCHVLLELKIVWVLLTVAVSGKSYESDLGIEQEWETMKKVDEIYQARIKPLVHQYW